LEQGISAISSLPKSAHELILSAHRHAIAAAFLFSGFVAMSGAITIYFLQEQKLRDVHYREEAPELEEV
jgi:predicted transcriptional regulator of viral defense system